MLPAEVESLPRGLTEAEVHARRLRGLGNAPPPPSTRTYGQIFGANAFTFINTVLYVTSIALIVMGLWGDALATAGLVLLNVIVAVAQEARAKRTLDRITLLTRPTVVVRRDSREMPVDQADLVVGDVVAVRPGDQLVADGVLVSDAPVDLDESLLTGESEPVTKHGGDIVYSGSFCLAGSGLVETREVGARSLANRMTAGARAFRQEKTPLQREIDLIIRIMILVVMIIGGPVVLDVIVRVLDVLLRWLQEPLPAALQHAYGGYPLRETVRSASVVVALVPQGLGLMIVVTYAVAAVRLIGKGALVQQANAVESLSHVDVLCLDKTGTLTTNRLVFDALTPVEGSESEVAVVLGDVVASMSDRNRTAEAIAAALPGTRRTVRHEVAFSPARKWSAVAFDGGEFPGAYVLGAPDVLAPHVAGDGGWQTVVDGWVARGRRVLLLASVPGGSAPRDENGSPCLPSGLRPLGLVAIVDELRTEAATTLRHFADLGVHVKLISGDDPRTVAALAVQADFPEPVRLVSGAELDAMDDAAFAQAARDATVIGRTSPKHKERLVAALRAQGRYVAMIGDGVNDVLALKKANLAIAVRSGSPAARGVADLVLLRDSFAPLPAAVVEGQRIVGGMYDTVKLFLARSLTATAVIVGALLVEAPFPITPRHNSLVALMAVGIPTLALAAWAAPIRPRERLLRSIGPFIIPAVLTSALVGLIVYLAFWRVTANVSTSQSALTTTLVGCGLLLVFFAQPSSKWIAGGDGMIGDWRPAALVAVLAILFMVGVYLPAVRIIFDFARLPAATLAPLVLIVILWAISLRWIWRRRLFQRWFGLIPYDDLGDPESA